MKVYNINYSQFSILQHICSSFIVIFQPSWRKKDPKLYTILQYLVDYLHPFVNEIISVDVIGSDDCAEYLIQDLRITTLPALVIYLNQQVVFKSDILVLDEHIRVSLLRILSTMTFPSIHQQIQSQQKIITSFIHDDTSTSTVGTIFIAGDKSQVGKSSVCLGLLSSLIQAGFSPSTLAYIKPVTQCEAEQPVAKFCKEYGISYRGIGPVVFYKGFTRAYLQNETDSSADLLQHVMDSVNEISVGKKLTIVDGVGYPSVGSIVNLSNATIAKALGSPVLLVGKPGVGDAVDSYNLNATYFESFGVRVLGGIFNKLSLDGFYNIEECKASVSLYFQQYRQSHSIYGFIPMISKDIPSEHMNMTTLIENDRIHPTDGIATDGITTESESKSSHEVSSSPKPSILQDSFITNYLHEFRQRFDIERLLKDIFFHRIMNNVMELIPSSSNIIPTIPSVCSSSIFPNITTIKSNYSSNLNSKSNLSSQTMLLLPPIPSYNNSISFENKSDLDNNDNNNNNSLVGKKRSRNEIESLAASKGAKIG